MSRLLHQPSLIWNFSCSRVMLQGHRVAVLDTERKPMRNAIGLSFAIATAALVGVDNHSGLAQEQAKMKLAPPQVFQPPFPTRSALLPKVSVPSTSPAKSPLTI